jgi:tyrosinase
MRTRQDIWKLKEWDDTILWYAKAIALMQTRPVADPTSWRYQAAIHDYIPGQDPLAQPGDVLPSTTDQRTFWRQCQHGTWFFLPWHRMFLFYFEQTIAAAIAQLGGPAGWSLPYWNYSDSSNPNAQRLPPAFRAATMPDGSPNPLLVQERQEGNDGGPVGDSNDVDLSCLRDPVFASSSFGGNPGFGGAKSKFSHSGGGTGMLEMTPHGSMHVAVGGFMGAFNTAGLDPIFWLHHSNIDRLWNVWLKGSSNHANPPDALWNTGVTFEIHDASGKVISFTSSQVVDSTAAPLSYQYEDESDPFSAGGAPHLLSMAEEGPNPEMAGASTTPVTLTGDTSHTTIATQPPSGPVKTAMAASTAPRKIYLNLENITGEGKPERYSVYLNVPEGGNPSADHYAGVLPMFGVVEASKPDENHPGSGLNYSLEVGNLVRALQAKGAWDPKKIRVSFVAKRKGGNHKIQVGRVSLYYT